MRRRRWRSLISFVIEDMWRAGACLRKKLNKARFLIFARKSDVCVSASPNNDMKGGLPQGIVIGNGRYILWRKKTFLQKN